MAQQLGETSVIKKVGKKLADIDPKLLTRNNPNIKIGTLPVEFIFATFPYQNQGDRKTFARENKERNLQLVLATRNLYDKETKQDFTYGLPYGTYPRLMLYYICSEVRRTQSPIINFGDTFKELMEKIGVPYGAGGGKKLRSVEDQFLRFSNCDITLQYAVTENKKKRGYLGSLAMVRSLQFWEEEGKDPDRRYQIELTQDFYTYLLRESATIFNAELIPLLNNEAFLIDLYLFLNLQAYYAYDLGKNLAVSFESLHSQFGTKSELKEFKRMVKENIEKLIKIPGIGENLHVGLSKEGIIVKKESRPSISKREEKQLDLNLK